MFEDFNLRGIIAVLARDLLKRQPKLFALKQPKKVMFHLFVLFKLLNLT